jgi:hypothetical protein
VANDLITERNIVNPTRITIHSLNVSKSIKKDIKPFYSSKVDVVYKSSTRQQLKISNGLKPVTYKTVFYGRGRGIHSTSPFTGYMLKDVLNMDYMQLSVESIRRGMLSICAIDGYRIAVSYSELFNRNDQQEFILVDKTNAEGGKYMIFPACDFFSDRAIQAITEIRFNLL